MKKTEFRKVTIEGDLTIGGTHIRDEYGKVLTVSKLEILLDCSTMERVVNITEVVGIKNIKISTIGEIRTIDPSAIKRDVMEGYYAKDGKLYKE